MHITGIADQLITLGFLQNLGPWEMLAILGIGLLLFGKRLPEVGRSMGKGIVEFKRGLKGIEDDIEEESSKPAQIRAEKPAPPIGESVKKDEAVSQPASSED